MNRRSFLAALTAAGSGWLAKPVPGAQGAAAALRRSAATQSELVSKTGARFLQTLRPGVRQRIIFKFPVPQAPVIAEFPSGKGFNFVGERYGESMWTNFPVSDVPRPGVRMGELLPDERESFHDLLRNVLSPMGYQKLHDIMDADQVVANSGEPYAAGLDAYTIAFFGEPSATTPWMLQFGGHHLGLNVTFAGDKAVCAPLHLGVLPAKFQQGGRTVRALGRENDQAFDLFAMLTPQQRQSCVIQHEISDLVRGPGHPDASLVPHGLPGADMTKAQSDVLLNVMREWVGVLNDAFTAQRFEELQRELPETRFAWSGATTHEPGVSGEEYFRIHGPSVLIEFAPQPIQGGYKLHVHTIMRDLKNDYGKQMVT